MDDARDSCMVQDKYGEVREFVTTCTRMRGRHRRFEIELRIMIQELK